MEIIKKKLTKGEKFILTIEMTLITMVIVFGFFIHPVMGAAALMGAVFAGIFITDADDQDDFMEVALIGGLTGLAIALCIAVRLMQCVN